jgi:hypothetical protein
MQLSVSVSKRSVLFRLSAIKCNFFFKLTNFSQLIKGVNTHLIALVFLLKLINDTLFVLWLSTPEDKTMFSHNHFTTGESSTELQMWTFCRYTSRINVSLSFILLILTLKDNSATSTIWIKSSQGHINPPLVRAEIKVFVASVDFMTCNKPWKKVSSLDWAFFLWFLWTSFNQNMDILRVKLVHKTEQRTASSTMKFKPYCKSCKDFLLEPQKLACAKQCRTMVGICGRHMWSAYVVGICGRHMWSAFSWVQVWLACRLAFCSF